MWGGILRIGVGKKNLKARGSEKTFFRNCSKWSQKRGLPVEKHSADLTWLSTLLLQNRGFASEQTMFFLFSSGLSQGSFSQTKRNCWSWTVYYTKTSAVVTESLKIRSQLPHLLAGPAFADDLGGAEPPFALSALKLARAWAGRPNQETESRNV